MKIVKNNKRISVLELIKFFAAIAIVFFHAGLDDHWEHLWLLVSYSFSLRAISISSCRLQPQFFYLIEPYYSLTPSIFAHLKLAAYM